MDYSFKEGSGGGGGAGGGRRPDARKAALKAARKRRDQAAALTRSSSVERYRLLKRLGKGSFGSVDAVEERESGRRYALKTVIYDHGSGDERSDALDEARLLKTLSHPLVVKFHEAFESSQRDKLYIVMELCHGTLVQAMKHAKEHRSHFTQRRLMNWLFQLAMALEYLHSRHVLHRDVKPDNIFLSAHGHVVKLGDFGLVRVLESTFDMARTRCGTPLYGCSPEICRAKPYNQATDLWGLGIVCYELMALRLPFTGHDGSGKSPSVYRLFQAAMNDRPADLPSKYSPALRSLVVDGLLAKEAEFRPSATAVLSRGFVSDHIMDFLHESNAHVAPSVLETVRNRMADGPPDNADMGSPAPSRVSSQSSASGSASGSPLAHRRKPPPPDEPPEEEHLRWRDVSEDYDTQSPAAASVGMKSESTPDSDHMSATLRQLSEEWSDVIQ